MRGDRHLPFWLEQGIESSLRDTEEDIPVVSFTAMSSAQAQHSLGSSHIGSPVVLTPMEGTSPAGPGIHGEGSKGPWMDLDKFYEDDSEQDDSENSDEEQVHNIDQDDEDDEDDEEDEDEEERKGEDPRDH